MKIIRFFLFFTFLFSFSLSYTVEKGKASFYHKRFIGKRTASGIIYKADDLICAHRKYPFGSYVYVLNPSTKQRVKVMVTDRGPFSRERVIDLSYAAAERIGLIAKGVGVVEVYPVIDSLENLPLSTLIKIKPLEIKK